MDDIIVEKDNKIITFIFISDEFEEFSGFELEYGPTTDNYHYLITATGKCLKLRYMAFKCQKPRVNLFMRFYNNQIHQYGSSIVKNDAAFAKMLKFDPDTQKNKKFQFFTKIPRFIFRKFQITIASFILIKISDSTPETIIFEVIDSFFSSFKLTKNLTVKKFFKKKHYLFFFVESENSTEIFSIINKIPFSFSKLQINTYKGELKSPDFDTGLQHDEIIYWLIDPPMSEENGALNGNHIQLTVKNPTNLGVSTGTFVEVFDGAKPVENKMIVNWHEMKGNMVASSSGPTMLVFMVVNEDDYSRREIKFYAEYTQRR